MPTPGPQIEILDLRHCTGRQLRPILEEEARVWNARLRWDYTASTELLLQYLDSAMLPGFVALLRGRIVGFCFAVYEGSKAVVGDVFVLESTPSRLAVTHTLLRHLLEVLQNSPGVDRIESQLLLFDAGILSPAFTEAGFTLYPRLFLELDLHTAPAKTPVFPPEVDLAPWNSAYYEPTAELIHAAYIGHLDSEINDQYRSLHGSLRFLHNIVRFPGCGTFDPEVSFVLRDRTTQSLVAAILCSAVSPGIAHVTQLCVLPARRGHSLGANLLAHCIARLIQRGYRTLTLTVSEANQPALALYRTAGFTDRLRFEAVVLPHTHKPAPPPAVAAKPKLPPRPPAGLFSALARRKTTPTRG